MIILNKNNMKSHQNPILSPELRAEMLQAIKTSSFVQAKVEEAKKVLNPKCPRL